MIRNLIKNWFNKNCDCTAMTVKQHGYEQTVETLGDEEEEEDEFHLNSDTEELTVCLQLVNITDGSR